MANGNTADRQTSDDIPMLLPPLPPSLASHPRYCTNANHILNMQNTYVPATWVGVNML